VSSTVKAFSDFGPKVLKSRLHVVCPTSTSTVNVPRIHDKVLCALDSDTADQQSKPNQQEVLTKENLLTLLI